MTNPMSNLRLTQVAGDLAADTRSLDALKREARNDPHAAVKKAATQFEALFMQMVLKSMRDAMPKSGLLGGDTGTETYTSMLDQQLATKMAGGGTGLADVIARQLTRQLPTQPGVQQPAPIADNQAAAPADKYAQLARRSLNAASRYEALTPTAESQRARAEYLARSAPVAGAAAPITDHGSPITASGSPITDHRSRITDPQRNFVLRHWDSAVAAERATGVPAKFIVSQAALESGWGKQEIKHADGLPSHNLFGIKAGASWKGRTVEVVTTECENGVPKKVVEKFRAYNNYTESFRDWALLMKNNPRYAQVLEQGRSGAGFAYGLQRAGYATDPNYGDKLARVIGAVGQAVGGV
jgi:flagellar protein FlgJ